MFRQTCRCKALLFKQMQIESIQTCSSCSICRRWKATIRLIQVQITPMMIHSVCLYNIKYQIKLMHNQHIISAKSCHPLPFFSLVYLSHNSLFTSFYYSVTPSMSCRRCSTNIS